MEQLVVAKYVDRRIKFFLRVSLEDQNKYYETHGEKFSGKSFDEVSGEIYKLLADKEADRKLEEYVWEIRLKSDIVIPGEVPDVH